MKLPRLHSLSFAAFLTLPVLAHAHPGHDGDHDVIWEFGHLVDHPIATLACLTLVAAVGWAAWRLVKSAGSAKAGRVRRD